MLLTKYANFINNNFNTDTMSYEIEKDDHEIVVRFYTKRLICYDDGRLIKEGTFVGKTTFEADDENIEEYIQRTLANSHFTWLVSLGNGDFESLLEDDAC